MKCRPGNAEVAQGSALAATTLLILAFAARASTCTTQLQLSNPSVAPQKQPRKLFCHLNASRAETHAPLASGTPQNKPIEPHMSLFEQGTALARQVKSSDGKLRTKELLDVCRSVLPIVGEYCTESAA